MISLMTLALIWSRFWSGEPRHKQSLFGSKCPFCTSLVPSAGSAAPSSWFTHSWVQTNVHIHQRSHTHTQWKCVLFQMYKADERHLRTVGCSLHKIYFLLISMKTGTRPFTSVSHLERSLVVRATGKTTGSACRHGDKPRDWDFTTQA